MALIRYPEHSDLAPEALAAIEHFEKDHGRPTLLRSMMAWSPPALDAMEMLYHPTFERGLLSREFKEALFVAAATARECPYCAGGHSRLLVVEFGHSEEDVRAMRDGQSSGGWSDKELALIVHARRAVTEPAAIEQGDIDALIELGWSEQEIVEGTLMAAHAAFTTTLAQAMHLEHDSVGPGFEGYF